MATSLGVATPRLTFASPALQNLYTRLSLSLPLSSSRFLSDPQILSSISRPLRGPLSQCPRQRQRRRLAVFAESDNGAEQARHYDFDLFTIGAGSGGFCESRFAASSGASVAIFGLTEEQAIQDYGDVDIYTANFRPLKATLSGLPDRVFMNVVACAKTNKVVGLDMCGNRPVAIKAGLTKADFDSTVRIHPAAAEEFARMRTSTREIRRTSEEKTDSEANAPAGV